MSGNSCAGCRFRAYPDMCRHCPGHKTPSPMDAQITLWIELAKQMNEKFLEEHRRQQQLIDQNPMFSVMQLLASNFEKLEPKVLDIRKAIYTRPEPGDHGGYIW